MAVTATPIFPQAIATVVVAVTSSVATGFTAGANGSKITAIGASNSGAISDLQIFYNGTAAANQIGIVSVPAGAGVTAGSAVPTYDVLRSAQVPFFSYDSFGNRQMFVAPTNTLAFKTSIASGVNLYIEAASF